MIERTRLEPHRRSADYRVRHNAAPAQYAADRVTLSPYLFPFSDNTLLPSGNRFGIYLTRIDDIPDVARIMRLSFVWFPKDFVPPRERPFDLDVETPPVVDAPASSAAPRRGRVEGDDS